MRFLFNLFIGLIISQPSLSQKPIADTSCFDKWPSVSSPIISNDANYVGYTINNRPLNSQTLVLKSTMSSWEIHLPGARECRITGDSKFAVFRMGSDSICLLTLGKEDREFIPKVNYFDIWQGHDKMWLVYQQVDKDGVSSIIINGFSATSKAKIFDVIPFSFSFNEESAVLVYQTRKRNESRLITYLHWRNLITDEDKMIWSGEELNDGIYSFDRSGNQFSFITEKNNRPSIWHYKVGQGNARRILSDTNLIEDNSLTIRKSALQFSQDGERIFFELIEKEAPKSNQRISGVNVWSYKDIHLQTEQYDVEPRIYLAAWQLTENKLVRLQDTGDMLESGTLGTPNKYILIKHGGGTDFWWQKQARSSVFLVSTKDGRRTLLKDTIPYGHDWDSRLSFQLSPWEKYVVYFDPLKAHYFSYEVASGRTKDLTSTIKLDWKDQTNGAKFAGPLSSPVGVAGWLAKDSAILIYDGYDIWNIDPSGMKKPVNITGSYGREHKILFRIAKEPNDNQVIEVSKDGSLLLTAFDVETKDNGFYRIFVEGGKAPELLTMGKFIYFAPGITKSGMCPLRAKKNEKWIVSRENAREAPNYFITSDFAHYKPISEIQPQKEYNWLTVELIHWKKTDSSICTGILYKPEDFNVKKKYPVIFNYYEERAHELNEFKRSDYSRASINIPYFVSRGYIVCVPDILYDAENPTENLIDRVVSAARFLESNEWVDVKRMGLNGHSYGGAETITLITHTNIFAAAVEGSGACDAIASYFQLTGYGVSRQYLSEIGQGHRKGSLWERENGFKIVNMSRINSVTTPLLMMHNRLDGAVPWAQAIELYIGMRRLEKRVWLLDYDNEEHFLKNKNNAMDYTVRMSQFYDHYLMGRPAPKWMIEGIPARLKGVMNGFELDGANREP